MKLLPNSLRVLQRVTTSNGPGPVSEIPGPGQKIRVRVNALETPLIPVRGFDTCDLRPLNGEDEQ